MRPGILSACGLLFLLAPPAWSQFGPPQPRAAACCYSLGVGLHNVNSTWTPYDYEVARSRIFVEGSYGFNDSLEGFARVGGSDWVINDVETYEPGKRHDVSSEGYPAFASLGLRGALWECEGWSIGASLEAAWYAGIEKYIRWDYDVYQRLYIDSTVEFNIGLSLGCDLGVGLLYLGPLIHFGYASGDVRTHEFGPGWDTEDDIDALNVRDKGGLGAFLGWQMPLGEGGWHFQLEGSVLNGGFGGAIAFFKTL
jgi:hypothetical protein